MFVLYDLRTNRVDCDARGVYELDDEEGARNLDGSVNEKYLDEIGWELARDNAEIYGIDCDDEDEEDSVSYSYEILDKTREEVEEEYGNISSI